MRNKHPGVCYRCGKPVAAGAGHFEKVRGGGRMGVPRWRTQHADCAIIHREPEKATRYAEVYGAQSKEPTDA